MTEEVKIEDQNTPDNEHNEPNPIEVKARELGWRPREEFSGDEDSFVDAKEFVARQPLFEKIEHQSRELKNVKKALDALQNHHSRVAESEYKRALATLEAKKAEAIDNADGQTAIKIERQIAQAEQEFRQLNQEAQTPKNDPEEFVSWKAKNSWYDKDESMRIFADAYGTKLAKGGMSPPEVLDAVSKKIKAEFPHKFVNPNKANAPDVGVSGAQSRSSSSDKFELTETERSVMNTLVRSGTMTKEQYITEIKKLRG
jgi:hypothetical protein